MIKIRHILLSATCALSLIACEKPESKHPPATAAPYNGTPYLQSVWLVGAWYDASGRPWPIKGSCDYQFGTKTGNVTVPGTLKLPMTDQRQALALKCSGKTGPRGPLGLGANTTLISNNTITTSFLGLAQRGPLRQNEASKYIMMAQKQIIISRGVQLLPATIGLTF